MRGNDATGMWAALGWQADCSVSGNCVSIHRRTKGALARTSARRFGLIPLQVSPCHSHLLFLHEKHGSLCYVSARWVHIRRAKRWRSRRALFFRFFRRARRWVRTPAPLGSRPRSAGRKRSTVQEKPSGESSDQLQGDDVPALRLCAAAAGT